MSAIFTQPRGLLGGFAMCCLLPLLYSSLKKRLHLSTPKLSLLEFVKIYLNPRTLLWTVGDGVEKLRGMLKRWHIFQRRMHLALVNNQSPRDSATQRKRNGKLLVGSWLNLLLRCRLKHETISVIGLPEMDANLMNTKGCVFRPISDIYENGSRITTYAYVEAECEPSFQSVQSHLVEVVKHSKTKCAHEPPNVRHAGRNGVNREAELDQPSRVACSDLLGGSLTFMAHRRNTPLNL